MMEQPCWDDSNIKYESHLNFAAANTSEDDDFGYGKKKLSRDPLSHRIIEKRRRDRMNNCLADLSRLIPQDYMKKGRGRVEKTEIIEMAIRHMKHLMSHPCSVHGLGMKLEGRRKSSPPFQSRHISAGSGGEDLRWVKGALPHLQLPEASASFFQGTCCKSEEAQAESENLARSYRLGYHDCLTETLHFLVDSEGYLASSTLCSQLASHLNQHCDSVLTSDGLRSELCRLKEESASNGYHMNGTPPSVSVGQESSWLKEESANNGYLMSGTPPSASGGQESGSDSSSLTQLSSVNNVSPTSSSSEKCSSIESKCSVESGYKFKNYIQRRFENSIPGPAPSGSNLVPGFALSPRGHYYLPICLEPGLVPRESLQGDGEVILHPVTISVNFRPPPPQNQG